METDSRHCLLSVFVCLFFASCTSFAAQPQSEPKREASVGGTETPQETADTLTSVIDLARAGAPGLAVRMLERRQPAPERDMVAWIEWERARVRILSSRGKWGDLIDRLKNRPNGISPAFDIWARQELANAYLSNNNGEAARRELLALQLAAFGPVPSEVRARWRRVIMQSYLVDGQDADAERAMLRYRQEFGDAGQEWPLLRAQVLLRNKRPDLALSVLPDDKAVDVELLRTLARFQAGSLDAKKAWAIVKKLQKSKKLTPQTRSALWSLRAEVADALKDRGSQALAVERSLGQEEAMPRQHPLYRDGDDLWAVYQQFGQETANERGMLIGDDAAWYKVTDQLLKKSTVKGRALLALLALQGVTEEQRDEASRRLAKSLMASETGQRVLERLYLSGRRFADHESIPPSIRHRLTDLALSQGGIERASSLVRSLTSAPKGEDPFNWQLRRARVLILAGDDDRGADILRAALAGSGQPDTGQVDRLLQVVFDLQTVKRHDLAIELFERLLSGELAPKQRREILFWLAESHEATGEKEAAAELYLRSAALPGPFVLDEWAQTAKYQAAEVLAEIGLPDDAREIYQTLLRVTKDPTRQAVLRQRMQKLTLGDRQ
ncbi:MAG: tetratricopeptide repeat protein [Gammaproteobacteria bacterium]